MTSATFLTTVPEEKLPVRVSRAYEGAIPSETCDYLASRIIDCAKTGILFPLQPMDVYGDIWAELERTVRHLPSLDKAAVSTYLHKAVDNLICRHFNRRVQPMRQEYREVEGLIGDAETTTAHDLAECLADRPWARERRLKAAALLEEVYAALLLAGRKVAVCAFRAYVEANGNMLVAAEISGIGKSAFYAHWPRWIEVAKLCSEKKGI